MADIDIDFKTEFDPLDLFDAVPASMVQNDKLKRHSAGVYFQDIPRDKITGLSAIPYKQAEELGYFKIDFLHLDLLKHFESKSEIKTLLKKEPNWNKLKDPNVVSQLFQIHKHYDLINKIQPKSVQELADTIALIRPAKRYLINRYCKDRESVRDELYQKPSNGKPYYKRSHAVAYALTICLQLHIIV